jgi:hypothetical protein
MNRCFLKNFSLFIFYACSSESSLPLSYDEIKTDLIRFYSKLTDPSLIYIPPPKSLIQNLLDFPSNILINKLKEEDIDDPFFFIYLWFAFDDNPKLEIPSKKGISPIQALKLKEPQNRLKILFRMQNNFQKFIIMKLARCYSTFKEAKGDEERKNCQLEMGSFLNEAKSYYYERFFPFFFLFDNSQLYHQEDFNFLISSMEEFFVFVVEMMENDPFSLIRTGLNPPKKNCSKRKSVIYNDFVKLVFFISQIKSESFGLSWLSKEDLEMIYQFLHFHNYSLSISRNANSILNYSMNSGLAKGNFKRFISFIRSQSPVLSDHQESLITKIDKKLSKSA